MKLRSEAQIIETFHLLFLRVLLVKGADWCTLKGGANLRYFFDSPRYSNDIDLDFQSKASWTIAKKVGGLLEGRTQLAVLARQSKIGLAEVSASKETETTLRWKIALSAAEHDQLIRTKVEFSGRDGQSDDVALRSVPNEIVAPYGLHSPCVLHYRRGAAIAQKIAALALRSETKARDIFDLDLLLRQHNAEGEDLSGVDPAYAKDAAERAMSIPFASFTSEVAPFLDAELASLYDEASWDNMRMTVADGLDAIVVDTQRNGGRT